MRQKKLQQNGKIYTKKGDRGKTSLFDKKKIYKSNRKVESYGTVDELNSIIGVARSFIKIKTINSELVEIQNDLLEIGSSLAVSKTKMAPQLKNRPQEMENLIDELTNKLPPLSNFILPGGVSGASFLHHARTVARRAERRVVGLSTKEKIDPVILIYLNRLSDLLFVMARFVNHKEKQKDEIWRKK